MLRLSNPVTPLQLGTAAALASVGVGAAWAAWAWRRNATLDLSGIQTAYFQIVPEGAEAPSIPSCEPGRPCVRTSTTPWGLDKEGPTAKPTSETWKHKTFEYVGDFKTWTARSNVDIPDLPAIPTPGIPWLGPVIATSVNFLKSLIKKKKNYISGAPGYAEVIATRPFSGARVNAVIEWGHMYGAPNSVGVSFPCGRIVVEGVRATTGKVPSSAPQSIMPSPGLGKWDDQGDACAYGMSGNGDKWMSFALRDWVPAAGPALPEIGVVVQGGQTDVILWLPGRAGLWWYDVKYRVLPL